MTVAAGKRAFEAAQWLRQRIAQLFLFTQMLTGWRRAVCALGLGAAGAGALAPLYLLPLLAVSFTGLVWLMDGAAARKEKLTCFAVIGWWYGFGYFLFGIYWLALSLLVDASAHAWLVPFALTLLPGGLALFPALACIVYASYMRWRGVDDWRRVLLFAVAWSVLEYVRGHVLTGFPWNLAGQSLAAFPAAAQTASIYGLYGLSLVTVLLAAAPASAASRGGVSLRPLAIALGGRPDAAARRRCAPRAVADSI